MEEEWFAFIQEVNFHIMDKQLLIVGPREARNPNLNIDQRIAYYACAPGL